MSLPQHIIENGSQAQTRISGTKRKRANHESVEEEIAWTAVRCQRLLRSITSRIASLRKLLDINTDGRSSDGGSTQNRKPRPKTSEHWSSVDPAWLPDGKPKSQGRTYTAKAKQEIRKPLKSRNPNLAFPSPFVKRIGSAELCNGEAQSTSLETRQPDKKTRRSRQLPIKPQSARQEAENGLTAAVSSLLSNTKAVGQVRKGSRSLLSTCLRKVPGYIELGVEDAEAENRSEDVTTEVFGFLEDFGSRDGWVGLREVTRRQCIHLVAKAISDDMVSENTIRSLMDICSSQGALSEGQDLLRAWLERAESPSAASLNRLDSFTTRHGCDGFKFGILNHLGGSQGSDMVRFGSTPCFWKDILSSLTGESSYEATQCLTSCVSTYAILDADGELKGGIRSHMRDLALKATVMATASILVHEPFRGAKGLFDGLVAVAAQIALERQRRSKARRLSDFETLFTLGAQLLLGLNTSARSECSVFTLDVATKMLESRSVRSDDQVRRSDIRMQHEDFAGEITKGITTLEKFIGVTVTTKLLDHALDAIEAGSMAAPLLKQVALETTTVLRQGEETYGFDFEGYLKRLNSSSKPATSIQTPGQENKTGQFRWEEGLCEWVTATPFVGKCAVEDTDHDDASDDAEDTSPSNQCSPDVLALSPPPKRRRVQVKSPLWSRKVTKGMVMIPVHKARRRIGSRRSLDSIEDESGDELCM